MAKIFFWTMKSIEIGLLSEFSAERVLNAYTTTNRTEVGVVVAERNIALEAQLVLVIAVARIIRIVTEYGLREIRDRLSCFGTFWKAFMRSIQLLAKFIRECRLIYPVLLQPPSGDYRVNVANKQGVTVLLKEQLMAENDADISTGYYIEDDCVHAHNAGLFCTINLVLKLLQSMCCAPVAMQKKYPMIMTSFMEPLLGLYFTHLIAEFPQRMRTRRGR